MFIVGNTAPALALDRMGRRPTMLYGCAGLSVCMMMIAILLSFGQTPTSSAAVAFFFLFMLIFGGTINVVPWVYVSHPSVCLLPQVIDNDCHAGTRDPASGSSHEGNKHQRFSTLALELCKLSSGQPTNAGMLTVL